MAGGGGAPGWCQDGNRGLTEGPTLGSIRGVVRDRERGSVARWTGAAIRPSIGGTPAAVDVVAICGFGFEYNSVL